MAALTCMSQAVAEGKCDTECDPLPEGVTDPPVTTADFVSPPSLLWASSFLPGLETPPSGTLLLGFYAEQL